MSTVEEIKQKIRDIVFVDAVQKFNATPNVGEVFDIEKYNYANNLLNEHGQYIYKKLVLLLHSEIAQAKLEVVEEIEEITNDTSKKPRFNSEAEWSNFLANKIDDICCKLTELKSSLVE